MPEGKIDAIGKANTTTWSTAQISKGSSNLLRIISGQLSHMPAGEVMSAVVQKAAQGAFKITLNGETFTFKGLPAFLLGKEVNFVARKTAFAGKIGIELFWLGQHRAKGNILASAAKQPQNLSHQSGKQGNILASAAKQPQNLSQQSGKKVNILSRLPADLLTGIKAGKTVSGQVAQVQNGKMSVTIALAGANLTSRSTHYLIQTSFVHGLKQGQQFAGRIIAGINNSAVLEIQQQVPPANVMGLKKAATTLPMASFPMAPGDVIPAIVQKRLPNGHIQLYVQGISVEAPAPKSVAQGDLLMLKMTKPPSEFQLQSVQKNIAEKVMSVVKKNLSVSHESLAQNMTAIRDLVPALINDGGPKINGIAQLETWFKASESTHQKPMNGERLAQLVHASGTGMEAKLLDLAQKSLNNSTVTADLKALMLQLSNVQSGHIKHAEIIKMLSELSQQSATRIETNQALNVLAQMQGDPMRFELPMLVGQQLVNVYMSLQQQHHDSSDGSGQGDASEQSYSVLFALELSGLGNLRVDASISDTSVHARIYSEKSGIGQFIRNHIERLQTRLQDLDYTEVFLLAAQIPPDAEKQRRFDQLTHMVPTSLNMLDIIA